MSTNDDQISQEETHDTGLNLFTLKFKDASIEKQFNVTYVAQALPLTRIYMLIGLVAYISYSVLDFAVLGDEFREILMVRFSIIAVLGLLIVASFIRTSYKDMQVILSGCMAFGGGGIILMTAVLEDPFSYLYYAGLILIIIYSSNLLIFRFFWSTLISLALFSAYLLTAMIVNPIPINMLINNSFFLFVTVAWTIWTSYWQETYVRREFSQRHLLRQEVKRSARLLKEAEAGNRSKSEFLAVISHELRTPLNAIIGFSEIMQQKLYGSLGSDRYAEYVDDIAYSGRHLLGIINDILDLSKAESGKLEVREDEVDVIYAIDQALRMFRDTAAKEGVKLSFDVPEDEVVIWADERLLRQSVINLVSNAVKFTPQGGEVNVQLESNPDVGCTIRVSDTGIGIEPEAMDKVLQPFVQVESALSRENGGVGLGLPLVKKIVEIHDGDVEIDSTIGEGTVVTIRFPKWRFEGPAPKIEAEAEMAVA